eukprot:tig00000145_g8843.t1
MHSVSDGDAYGDVNASISANADPDDNFADFEPPKTGRGPATSPSAGPMLICLEPSLLEQRVTVRVEVHCKDTSFGDTVVLAGSAPELGCWQPSKALRLDGSAWPVWRGRFELRRKVGAAEWSAGPWTVEMKCLILRASGLAEWEGICANRTLEIVAEPYPCGQGAGGYPQPPQLCLSFDFGAAPLRPSICRLSTPPSPGRRRGPPPQAAPSPASPLALSPKAPPTLPARTPPPLFKFQPRLSMASSTGALPTRAALGLPRIRRSRSLSLPRIQESDLEYRPQEEEEDEEDPDG